MNENVFTENGKREFKSLLVTDMDLLYQISDARLLDKLNGTYLSKRDGVTRLYFFDRDDDIKAIIDEYKANRQ